MSEFIFEATDENFDSEVLKHSGSVLVDFWAEWCGPCKMIGPVLEELAGAMQGKLSILKMNVDENPLSPSKFGIRSIPTLILFKDGQPVATKIGAATKQALEGWLAEQL